MKIRQNYDAGKAIDTASYLGIRCNEDDVITRFRSRYDNVTEAMHQYYAFKEKHKDYKLPDEITPFVYIDHEVGTNNFLAQYLTMNLNFISCTDDDIWTLLRNSGLMKRQFLECTFSKADKTIIDDLVRKGASSAYVKGLIMELPYHHSIKLHISFMISDFSHYHNVLLETYKTVRSYVEELHTTKEAQQTMEKIAELLNDPVYDIVKRFKNIFKLSDRVDSFSFYFTLINPYILHRYKHSERQFCFGLGAYFRDTIENQHYMKHVALKTHYIVVGSDLRFKMIEMFSRYQTLCVADIVHHLNVSRSAVNVAMNILISNNLILFANSYKKSRQGTRTYFRSNPEYFKAVRKEMQALYYNLENVHHAGVEKYVLPKRKRRSDYQE